MAATTKALSESAIAEIVGRMQEGLNLLQVCRAAGVDYGNVARRIHESEELAALYARSRAAYAHAKVDELHEIAITEPDVMRARLRCDMLRWEISKVLPKIYGDKTSLEVTTNTVELTLEQIDARLKTLLSSDGLMLVPATGVVDVEAKRIGTGHD